MLPVNGMLKEGGNAIPDSMPVNRDDIKQVVDKAKSFIPSPLLKNLQADIGSSGYKVESGDIDLMVDAEEVVKLFKTENEKDPVKAA